MSLLLPVTEQMERVRRQLIPRTMYSMLAVMTFNVGYFLSVLAGTFLGEVGVGRFGTLSEH